MILMGDTNYTFTKTLGGQLLDNIVKHMVNFNDLLNFVLLVGEHTRVTSYCCSNL